MIRIIAMVAALAGASMAAQAESLDGQATYDLLFKNGTLDGIETRQRVVYDREVTNSAAPEAAENASGEVVLSFDQSKDDMAQLTLRKDDKQRRMGEFPASVGNPMIMVFYENTIRDMASTTGGSPYYIRNRIKDSLIQPTESEETEAELNGESVPVRIVRLYPFKDDPNAERMQGFGDLELTVTMSDAVPGWYLSFVAHAGEAYHSETRYVGLETLQ